jgi:hypothetical protein
MAKFSGPKICFVLLSISALNANAQNSRGNDSAYYVYFPNSITGRIYTSQKYSRFNLKAKNAPGLHYLPNTTFNLGVGATYHNFSLNIAYGFDFLNPGKKNNKTKYLDLQMHLYQPKWVTDVYGQLYKGFHLAGSFNEPAENYYRKDFRLNLFGLSRYYIFNSKRFSYRASFIQNELQKKSAGSFLAGAELYYGVVKADSNLIPKSVSEKYPQKNLSKINYLSIGPGIGYAYTQIVVAQFFITGSVTGNLAFSFANEHLEKNSHAHFSLNPVTRFRVAAGYNSRSWNISANWVFDNLAFKGVKSHTVYWFNTGNFRMVFAKRFYPGNRLQKRLRPLDKIFKE